MGVIRVKNKAEAGASEEKAVAKKGKKIKYKLSCGNVYVQSTYNNTIVSVTDLKGNIIVWASAGLLGFKGPKRATPYAATEIIKSFADRLKETGLKDVHVFVKGIGSGREAAVRAFVTQGFNVLSIKDMTPIPHNGCRPPKVRRV